MTLEVTSDATLDEVLALVCQRVERSAADKGLVIELDLPAQVAGPLPDPATLADLLECLLRLAIAVAESGTILLRLAAHPGSQRLHSLAIDSSAVNGAVTPSEPYSTLTRVLTSAQALCQALRGELHTEIRPGAGYSFTVTLPRLDPPTPTRVQPSPKRSLGPMPAPPVPAVPVSPPAAPVAQPSGDPEAPMVLVVDDDESARSLACHFLRKLPVRLLTANDGQQGLDAIKQYQPALVILDLMMPVMDGWQVLESLRGDQRWRALPVIVSSAMTDAAKALDLGACAILAKPITRERLVELVRQHLPVRQA